MAGLQEDAVTMTLATIVSAERNPHVDNPLSTVTLRLHGGCLASIDVYDMAENWPVGREVEIKLRVIGEDELHPCH